MRDIHPPWGETPGRWATSMALIALGLVADLVAGWAILSRDDLRGLAVHIAAALLWGVGVLYLQQEPERVIPTLSGWTVAALVIGVCAFPGLGTLGCSVAFAASYLLRRRGPRSDDESDLLQSMRIPAVTGKPVEVMRMQDVQPLVDVLREQNTELRRVVIKTLGDQGDQESVLLIRELLADPSPDVRSDAAVTLTRLEHDYNEEIHSALAQARRDPDDNDQQHELARLCYRYACNGLLDAVSGAYYLEQAREILQRLTARIPHRAGLWVDLARVAYALHDPDAALVALDRALILRPDHLDAYILSVEIAFGEQQWDRLLALAQQRRPAPEATRELLRWWAELHPIDPGGTWHG